MKGININDRDSPFTEYILDGIKTNMSWRIRKDVIR